jgi:hypothetical protein
MTSPLPLHILTVLAPFAKMFSVPTWKKAQLLCVGAILCQGARRISSILSVMGMAQCKRFSTYHRFLNRDQWSPLLGAQILLGLLIALIPSECTLFFVLDETIERRRGKNIKAKGCYRDAVRSTHNHVVTCFGLKWLAMCLIVRLPWSKRSWALPFLTFLQYSKAYDKDREHHHRTTLDYAKVGVRFIKQWIGSRTWTLLGDGGFASVELVNACLSNGGNLISRLRLDARLYEDPIDRQPGQKGRKSKKGKSIASFKKMKDDDALTWIDAEVNWYGGEKKKICYLSGVNLLYKPKQDLPQIRWVLVKDPDGALATIPLFSSDINQEPISIVEAFVNRFSIEILFEESRAHLGMETQRQWSNQAIIRSTPLIFAMFSIVCLIALNLLSTETFSVHSTAWHKKNNDEATFSDVIAYVRRYCWASRYLINSPKNDEVIKLKRVDFDGLIKQLSSSA